MINPAGIQTIKEFPYTQEANAGFTLGGSAGFAGRYALRSLVSRGLELGALGTVTGTGGTTAFTLHAGTAGRNEFEGWGAVDGRAYGVYASAGLAYGQNPPLVLAPPIGGQAGSVPGPNPFVNVTGAISQKVGNLQFDANAGPGYGRFGAFRSSNSNVANVLSVGGGADVQWNPGGGSWTISGEVSATQSWGTPLAPAVLGVDNNLNIVGGPLSAHDTAWEFGAGLTKATPGGWSLGANVLVTGDAGANVGASGAGPVTAMVLLSAAKSFKSPQPLEPLH